MNRRTSRHTSRLVLWITLATAAPLHAQQFNSDNYLSKPAGMATVILAAGQRSDMVMTTFSLIPKWEFTYAVYVVNTDNDRKTDNGYSQSFYFKYMVSENKAKTGGVAVKAGTGLDPGYLGSVGLEDAFQTYWANAPVTFPFFKNRLSWDVMPGLSYTEDFETEGNAAWAFTYSTRLGWYPAGPKLALVGEVFGGVGEVETIPEFKTGVRWEPNPYATFALTYGQEFNASSGAGFEIGMMLFTPPFFCIKGCTVPK